MKWKIKHSKPSIPSPNEGDTRCSTKFLFIPKIIDDKWVWLERVIKHEEYRQVEDKNSRFRIYVITTLEWVTTHYELIKK